MAERWRVEDFGGGKRGVMGILEGALVPLYLYNIKRMGNLPHVFFSELNFIFSFTGQRCLQKEKWQ
jgi:hypothetical protein